MGAPNSRRGCADGGGLEVAAYCRPNGDTSEDTKESNDEQCNLLISAVLILSINTCFSASVLSSNHSPALCGARNGENEMNMPTNQTRNGGNTTKGYRKRELNTQNAGCIGREGILPTTGSYQTLSGRM